MTAIIRSVDASEKTRHILSPLAQKLQLVAQTATLNQKFEQLSRTEQGVALVRSGMDQIVNDLASRPSAPVGALRFRVKRPKDGSRLRPKRIGVINGALMKERDLALWQKTRFGRFEVRNGR
jgi:hypothetical protein